MLAKQVITDQQGMPMGVFIPMQAWEDLTFQFPEIEMGEAQYEGDFYSDDFEEKWKKGIPVEEARQRLLKRVRSWGLPSKKS